MRVGLLGCGAIGGFVLEAAATGQAGDARIVAVAARQSAASRAMAERYGVTYVDPPALPEHDLKVIVEAASHGALRTYCPAYLRQSVDVITLSAGALADDGLLTTLVEAAKEGGSRLYVPSGGIAGMDGIKALILDGAEVTMTSSKPPRAWKGVEYVASLGIDLDHLEGPTVLYEGEARRAVKFFPQNVNIAAVLSLGGAGFDRTRVRVIADPGIERNVHEIQAAGPKGTIRVRMENVPIPTNPKTAYLAALSAVSVVRQLSQPLWIGG